MHKKYLGDSVYADFQDGMLKLTTENGKARTIQFFLRNTFTGNWFDM